MGAARCFTRWRENALEAIRQREVLARVVARMRHAATAAALDSWRLTVHRGKAEVMRLTAEETKAHNGRLAEDNGRLEAENGRLAGERGRLESELERRAVEAARALGSTVDAASLEVDALRRALGVREGEVAALRDEVVSLEDELARVGGELVGTMGRLRESEEQGAQLEDALEGAQKQAREFEEAHAEVEVEMRGCIEAVEALEGLLEGAGEREQKGGGLVNAVGLLGKTLDSKSGALVLLEAESQRLRERVLSLEGECDRAWLALEESRNNVATHQSLITEMHMEAARRDQELAAVERKLGDAKEYQIAAQVMMDGISESASLLMECLTACDADHERVAGELGGTERVMSSLEGAMHRLGGAWRGVVERGGVREDQLRRAEDTLREHVDVMRKLQARCVHLEEVIDRHEYFFRELSAAGLVEADAMVQAGLWGSEPRASRLETAKDGEGGEGEGDALVLDVIAALEDRVALAVSHRDAYRARYEASEASLKEAMEEQARLRACLPGSTPNFSRSASVADNHSAVVRRTQSTSGEAGRAEGGISRSLNMANASRSAPSSKDRQSNTAVKGGTPSSAAAAWISRDDKKVGGNNGSDSALAKLLSMPPMRGGVTMTASSGAELAELEEALEGALERATSRCAGQGAMSLSSSRARRDAHMHNSGAVLQGVDGSILAISNIGEGAQAREFFAGSRTDFLGVSMLGDDDASDVDETIRVDEAHRIIEAALERAQHHGGGDEGSQYLLRGVDDEGALLEETDRRMMMIEDVLGGLVGLCDNSVGNNTVALITSSFTRTSPQSH